MKLAFRPSAKAEFLEAIAWYETRKPGLGREFHQEVREALKNAQTNPGRYRKVRGEVRVIRLKRFWQFSVFFIIRFQRFLVIAVFHAKRDPEILKKRLE